MVEAAKRQAIELRIDIEGRQRGTDRGQIKVSQLNLVRIQTGKLVLRDNSDAHCLNVRQVIVEGPGRLRCREGLTARTDMVFEGPVARAAAGPVSRKTVGTPSCPQVRRERARVRYSGSSCGR